LQTVIDEKVHNYYWNQDLNCALTTLKILSDIFHLKIHHELLDATYGLNAGRFGFQCGLVQGTLMFIGIYGSLKKLTQTEIAEMCRRYVDSFQNKFGSMQCRELRPQGFNPNNPPHLCENLTKLSIGYSVEFISKELNG